MFEAQGSSSKQIVHPRPRVDAGAKNLMKMMVVEGGKKENEMMEEPPT